MAKIDSLDNIKKIWESNQSLRDIVIGISEIYYADKLELAVVAAYINATYAELAAVIKMSFLDEEILTDISNSKPPKTAWTLFANASEKEIRCMLEKFNGVIWSEGESVMALHDRLIQAAEPTVGDKIGALSSNTIEAMLKKGVAYARLDEWSQKFLKSMAAQRKMGKTLSDKQIQKLTEVLTGLADNRVIIRDSIDDDVECCNEVLDALGR